jgi:FixJ family two-component response regulator
MVNTFRDIRVAIDSMRRGAFDHLLKPFERDYLLNAVDRALEHRQARREMHNYQHSLEQLVKARTSAMTVTASAMANESAPLLQSQP